jgi:hypothetical protein
LGLLLQAVQPDVGTALGMAEHLTLSGALIVGVIVLWKSNQKKDDLLIKTTEQVTAALATAAASNVELRKQVAGLEKTVEQSGRGMAARA